MIWYLRGKNWDNVRLALRKELRIIKGAQFTLITHVINGHLAIPINDLVPSEKELASSPGSATLKRVYGKLRHFARCFAS